MNVKPTKLEIAARLRMLAVAMDDIAAQKAWASLIQIASSNANVVEAYGG